MDMKKIVRLKFPISDYRYSPTVCVTPITVMGSVMGLFPLRNGVYLVTAIK